METLIITDSKGRGLGQYLTGADGMVDFELLVHSGAGFELAVIKSMRELSRFKPKFVILTVGICDITIRNRQTKITSLRFRDIGETAQHVMSAARATYETLTSTHSCKVSLATITGLDLADYNHPCRRFMSTIKYDNYSCNHKIINNPQQDLLNQIVIEVNRQITGLNKKHGVPTTWLSTAVHSYYRHTHHHNYRKLSDGCHLDEQTKAKWGSQIVNQFNDYHIAE